MKSITIKFTVAALLIIGLFASCVNDDEGFIEDIGSEKEEIFFTSNIFGVVSDLGDMPIEGVNVTYNGESTVTDAEGIYRFDDVEVGSQHNVVKLEKDGFFENARTFRTTASSTLYQKTILQEKNFSISFESSEATLIESERVRIQFPANSIVVESSNEPYIGEIQIAIQNIDPTLARLQETMPGDLTAREDDNTLSTLESFGMVNVELQSSTGKKLQIAANQNVQMSYRVADEFLSNAPSTIDMWSFDFDLGVWVKDGQATLSGDTYTGKVSHFSCWNYDESAPSVVVNGQLMVNGKPISYTFISITNADNKGGRGQTDSKGRFSGRVEAGVELSLQFNSTRNCEDFIYNQKLGPYLIDTDLGVIDIEIDMALILNITGTAVDCDFNPIEAGHVRMLNYVFPIVDGDFNIYLTSCSTEIVDLRIIDDINIQQLYVNDLEISGDYDLGDLVVCDDIEYYVRVDNIIDQPINIIENLQFKVTSITNDSIVGRIESLDSGGSGARQHMYFYVGSINNMDVLETTSYPVVWANFIHGIGTNVFYRSENQGTVTIESFLTDINGDRIIKGSYSVESIENSTEETKIITGSFRLLEN